MNLSSYLITIICPSSFCLFNVAWLEIKKNVFITYTKFCLSLLTEIKCNLHRCYQRKTISLFSKYNMIKEIGFLSYLLLPFVLFYIVALLFFIIKLLILDYLNKDKEQY